MAKTSDKTKASETGGKSKRSKTTEPKTAAKASRAAETPAPAKKSGKTKSTAAKKRQLAAGGALAMDAGKSTRSFVDDCINGLVENPQYEDDTPLSSIPVSGEAVGQCLNASLTLVPEWGTGPQGIKDSWTVDVLTQKTNQRRR